VVKNTGRGPSQTAGSAYGTGPARKAKKKIKLPAHLAREIVEPTSRKIASVPCCQDEMPITEQTIAARARWNYVQRRFRWEIRRPKDVPAQVKTNRTSSAGQEPWRPDHRPGSGLWISGLHASRPSTKFADHALYRGNPSPAAAWLNPRNRSTACWCDGLP